jgi:hypothetical protein
VVAVVVGVLVIAGLGFAIGWIAAPNDDGVAPNAVATSRANGNGNSNGSNGSNGNGQNVRAPQETATATTTAPATAGDSTTPPLPRAPPRRNRSNRRRTMAAPRSPRWPPTAGGSRGLEGDVVTASTAHRVTARSTSCARSAHDVNDSITSRYPQREHGRHQGHARQPPGLAVGLLNPGVSNPGITNPVILTAGSAA